MGTDRQDRQLLLRHYRAQRAEGTPAARAYAIAVDMLRDRGWLGDLEPDKTVRREIEGFTVSVTVVPDHDHGLGEDDVTGSFGDEKRPGCVKNRHRDWSSDYDYYYPATIAADYCADARAMGASKSVARDMARAWVERDMREDARRTYVGVQVRAALDGVEVGFASLWGIDVIDFDSYGYLADVAEELIEEALTDARAWLVAHGLTGGGSEPCMHRSR